MEAGRSDRVCCGCVRLCEIIFDVCDRRQLCESCVAPDVSCHRARDQEAVLEEEGRSRMLTQWQ